MVGTKAMVFPDQRQSEEIRRILWMVRSFFAANRLLSLTPVCISFRDPDEKRTLADWQASNSGIVYKC